MTISAADVKTLRDVTGAGMMDCKNALAEAGGDMARAQTVLREKGLAAAGKRSARAANEGLVEARVSEDERRGVLVEVHTETDFVAKGDRFHKLAADISAALFDAGGDISDAAKDQIDVLIEDAQIDVQEKIELARAVAFETETGVVHAYLHKTGGWAKKGVLVEIEGDGVDGAVLRDLAHELALHIQFARPDYLRSDEVDEELIASERQIAAAKARNEGKPDEIGDRIAEGVVKKLYEERVLLEQPYVKEQKLSVGHWLARESGGAAHVVRFARFEIGEEGTQEGGEG